MRRVIQGIAYWLSVGLASLGLAAAIAIAPADERVTRHAVESEVLRLELLPTGYLVAVRTLPGEGEHWLRIRFRLAAYDATESAHLAIGLGDLYRYFESGSAPVGDGFIVGLSNSCPEKGVAVNHESYGGEIPGRILDCPTAYGSLNLVKEYTVLLVVSAVGEARFDVFDTMGVKVHTAVRDWNGMHRPHDRGLFIIPYSPDGKPNGRYELLELRAGVTPGDRAKEHPGLPAIR
jgi:hypothetical protein